MVAMVLCVAGGVDICAGCPLVVRDASGADVGGGCVVVVMLVSVLVQRATCVTNFGSYAFQA